MSVILKNACFINWQTLSFINTNIKVEEGKNASIEFFSNFNDIKSATNDTIIDCKGKYVTKSFAIGHHHAYSALATGMPRPKKTPTNFLEILKYVWWNLDKALDKDSIEASALATAIDCAKNGSSFVIDHHSSPNYINGALEIIAKSFEKIGISHLLCYEISDRDGISCRDKGIEETDSYLNNNQGLVGLHASFTVGDNTLKKAVELMEKHSSGIHIHVAEDRYDQDYCIKHYDKRVIERLDDFGTLQSPKTILAHCLHINDRERELINNSNAYVVENIESNINNKVGFFSSKNIGKRMFLGTDGMHSDMLKSAQSAYFLGQLFDEINFVDTYNRFRNIHSYISKNNFIGDGDNNLVVLDYKNQTEFNENNFLGHFIFNLTSASVNHLISDGKLILKDKILQNIDEDEVLRFTKEQSLKLWNKL